MGVGVTDFFVLLTGLKKFLKLKMLNNVVTFTASKFGASPDLRTTMSFSNNGQGLGPVGLQFLKLKDTCFAGGFDNVKKIEFSQPLNSLFIAE